MFMNHAEAMYVHKKKLLKYFLFILIGFIQELTHIYDIIHIHWIFMFFVF